MPAVHRLDAPHGARNQTMNLYPQPRGRPDLVVVLLLQHFAVAVARATRRALLEEPLPPLFLGDELPEGTAYPRVFVVLDRLPLGRGGAG